MATTTKITAASTIDISNYLKDSKGVALTGSKLQSALTKLANFETAVELNKSASLTVGSGASAVKYTYTAVKANGAVGPALSLQNDTNTFTSASALITNINNPTPAPTPAPTTAPTPAPTAAPTPAPTTAPKALTTSSTDNIVGTDGGDTFTAIVSTGNDNTLSATDKVDGGAGADALNVTLGADFGGFTTGSLKNVETVSLANATEVTRSFDATGVTGATTYNISGKTGANLSTFDPAATVNFSGVTGTNTLTPDVAKLSTTTDNALTIGLTNVGTSATSKATINAVNIQKLTVTSAGTANFASVSGATSATSLVVSGAAPATVDAKIASLTSIDASGSTGGATIDATGATLKTIKMGPGDDKVTATNVTTTATIDGGTGNDTLALVGAGGTYIPTMTNVEILSMKSLTAATTLALTKSSGLKQVTVADTLGANLTLANAGTGDLLVTFAAGKDGGSTITTDNSGAVTLTTVAASGATSESTTVTTALTADSASSATINIAKNTASTANVSALGATSVTVNADGTFTGGAVTATAAKNLTVNATAATTLGNFAAVNNLTVASTNKTVTLGNFDKFGSAALTGTGDSAKLVLGTLGTGTSTQAINLTATGFKNGFTAGTVNTTDTTTLKLAGLTGAVTVGNIGANTAGSVSVDLANTASTGAVSIGTIDTTSSKSVTVTAANTLGTLGVGAITVKDGSVGRSGSASVDVSGALGTVTLGAITASTITLNASGTLSALTYPALKGLSSVTVTGSASLANSVGAIEGNSVTFTGGSAVDTVTIVGVDSDSTSSTNAEATVLNISTGAGNDAVQYTMYSGQKSTAVSGTVALGDGTDTLSIIGVSSTTAIDASALIVTGQDSAIVVNGSAATGAESITGSAFDDSITGGAGNDTIAGGFGNDVLIGGAGNDSLLGGAGNDTITGGAGADTMTGSGTDTFVLTSGASPATSITFSDVTSGGSYDTGDTFTFNSAIDVITNGDFVSGTDKLDVTTSSAVTNLFGADITTTYALNTNAYIRGSWDSATNKFTVASGGADTLVLHDAASGAAASANGNAGNYIVLIGTAGVAAADFI